jgi:hypothetical protein
MAPRTGRHGKEVVIMRLVLDTSKTAFTVTREPEPKTEFGGSQQKVDRQTKRPEWVVEVLALDSERGEVIRVTVTGDQPKVSQGQPVQFSELSSSDWDPDHQRRA